jgi:NADH-quinone oxidoreductase subunit M
MPVFATFFIIAMLSSVGLPGLNGFIGEFLILAGSFQTSPRWTIVAATGVILAAIYLLWLIQRVFFGPITKDENRNVPDIAWNEIAALVPLVILMVWIGVRPNTFLRKMTPSVKQLLLIVQKTDAGNAVIAEDGRRLSGVGETTRRREATLRLPTPDSPLPIAAGGVR